MLFVTVLEIFFFLFLILDAKTQNNIKNFFEKIDANNVMVNKWAAFGVDANANYCK